jgi:hypothetical protein
MFTKHSAAWAALALGFAIVGAFIVTGSQKVKADNAYCSVTPTTAFLQNWSNVGLITVDDNWNGVPCINGYRGDDATAGEGVNPETVLADYSGVLDVNANRNDPNTFATGGVTEYDGIANPVVALKGSTTADFPNLIVRINSTGCLNPAKLTVTYNVRDLDSSANDSVQVAALHYRVGSSGDFTNLHAGFVADATDPGIAQRVSTVGASLPDDAKGVPQLQLRIMTANAAGTDEAIGIDDIRVGCAVPTAANVSISGRVTTSEGYGLRNVIVTVTAGNLAQPRTAITSAFGNYTIDGLEAGGTYIVSVRSKRYVFETPDRVITLLDSVGGVDFVTVPQE